MGISTLITSSGTIIGPLRIRLPNKITKPSIRKLNPVAIIMNAMANSVWPPKTAKKPITNSGVLLAKDARTPET